MSHTTQTSPLECVQAEMISAIGVWFDGWSTYCDALAINLQFACVMALGVKASVAARLRQSLRQAGAELWLQQAEMAAERLETLEALQHTSQQTFVPSIATVLRGPSPEEEAAHLRMIEQVRAKHPGTLAP